MRILYSIFITFLYIWNYVKWKRKKKLSSVGTLCVESPQNTYKQPTQPDHPPLSSFEIHSWHSFMTGGRLRRGGADRQRKLVFPFFTQKVLARTPWLEKTHGHSNSGRISSNTCWNLFTVASWFKTDFPTLVKSNSKYNGKDSHLGKQEIQQPTESGHCLT